MEEGVTGQGAEPSLVPGFHRWEPCHMVPPRAVGLADTSTGPRTSMKGKSSCPLADKQTKAGTEIGIPV